MRSLATRVVAGKRRTAAKFRRIPDAAPPPGGPNLATLWLSAAGGPRARGGAAGRDREGARAPALSGRCVLRGPAGAGPAGLAAAAVAGTAVPALAAAAPASSRRPAARAAASEAATAEPVVVHVRDARSGEMDIFAGTSHARLRDPDLAARLARAVP